MNDSIAAARADLAPTGTLNVGINFANILLTARDPVTRKPSGVALDLAHEFGRRLGVPVNIIHYESAGGLAESASKGEWQVGFLAIEPKRANEITFTAPYVEIEATYLVPPGSPFKSVDEVDRDGVRISVTGKAAYDLYLTRTLKHAQLFRTGDAVATFKQFVDEKMDALAGLRSQLEIDCEKMPGARILPGEFVRSGETDFGSVLHKARASGAKTIHLALGRDDVRKCIAQANRMGLVDDNIVFAASDIGIDDVVAWGPDACVGLTTASSFYWDRTPLTRAFSMPFMEAFGSPPNECHGWIAAALLHWRQVVLATKSTDATAVAERMRTVRVRVPDAIDRFVPMRPDGVVPWAMHVWRVPPASERRGKFEVFQRLASAVSPEAYPPRDRAVCE